MRERGENEIPPARTRSMGRRLRRHEVACASVTRPWKDRLDGTQYYCIPVAARSPITGHMDFHSTATHRRLRLPGSRNGEGTSGLRRVPKHSRADGHACPASAWMGNHTRGNTGWYRCTSRSIRCDRQRANGGRAHRGDLHRAHPIRIQLGQTSGRHDCWSPIRPAWIRNGSAVSRVHCRLDHERPEAVVG